MPADFASPEPRPHKIPESVLVVIHTLQGEVLLIERADAQDYWQSVTGSKDSVDEPLATTCRREVEERFSARRMATEHVAVYRSLLQERRERVARTAHQLHPPRQPGDVDLTVLDRDVHARATQGDPAHVE